MVLLLIVMLDLFGLFMVMLLFFLKLLLVVLLIFEVMLGIMLGCGLGEFGARCSSNSSTTGTKSSIAFITMDNHISCV